MSCSFRDFVQEEIQAIMDSMSEECRNDPVLMGKTALEWVEQNAEEFRNMWNQKHVSDIAG